MLRALTSRAQTPIVPINGGLGSAESLVELAAVLPLSLRGARLDERVGRDRRLDCRVPEGSSVLLLVPCDPCEVELTFAVEWLPFFNDAPSCADGCPEPPWLTDPSEYSDENERRFESWLELLALRADCIARSPASLIDVVDGARVGPLD